MNHEISLVRQFHEQFGFEVATNPTLLAGGRNVAARMATDIRDLLSRFQQVNDPTELFGARVCLALEELAESVEAHREGDLIAAADAWGDRMYLLLGDAVAMGLPAVEIFAEIHRSNMSKTVPSSENRAKASKGPQFHRPELHEILQSGQD